MLGQYDREQHDADPEREEQRGSGDRAHLHACRERLDLRLQRQAGRVRARLEHAQQMQGQCARRPRVLFLGISCFRVACLIHHLRRTDLDNSSMTAPPNKAEMATACQGLPRTYSSARSASDSAICSASLAVAASLALA